MINGWMPGAEIARSPNFSAGRAGQPIKAVVEHIAAGGYRGSIAWLCRPNGTSAHFMLSKRGEICQLVSIADTAYANGLSYQNGRWIDPEGAVVTPSWPGLTPPINPNSQTISIEHEGYPNEPWTDAMFAANTRVLQWIAAQTGLIYVPRTTLISHTAISPKNRPNCPGPLVDFAAIARAANGATPALNRPYRVIGGIDFAAVRTGRGANYPKALGDTLTLPVGYGVELDDLTAGWGHLSTGEGFVSMDLLTPVAANDLTFLHAPRIKQSVFHDVLTAASSPAAPVADELFSICAHYGICPAVFLGFFKHENSFGKAGLCATYDLKNPGNVRKAFNATRGQQLDIDGRGLFFQFASWQDGVADWCERIINNYVQKGRATVRQALPVYAPSSDGNAPDAYANDVVACVAAWRAR